MQIFEKVFSIVKDVPRGNVMTYGQIASIVGTTPRVVGYALHSNKHPETIPCHRVVHKNGELAGGYAFGGAEVQKKLLQKEGVTFNGDVVDMKESQQYFRHSGKR